MVDCSRNGCATPIPASVPSRTCLERPPLSQGDWKEQSGQLDVATMEEVGVYMGMEHEETLIEELPWTAVEELVAEVRPSSASCVPAVVRGVIALAGIASIASSLVRAVKVVGQSSDKVEKFMV